MSKVTVRSTPQALYPDGHNEVMTIINEGPWTVYLDSDSSINTSSISLPPTATIVWDEKRPLWCLAAGDSSVLNITRNSSAGDAGRAVTLQKIVTTKNVQCAPTGTRTLTSIFECSAYSTLFVDMDCVDGVFGTISSTEIQNFTVKWYSKDSDVSLYSDFYRTPQFLGRSGQFTLPVKADRCQIVYESGLSSTQIMNTTVYGTSRERPLSIDYLRNVSDSRSIISYLNAAAYGANTIEQPRFAVYDDVLINNQCIINGTGRRLSISMHFGSAITTAGELLIRGLFTSSHMRRVTVPTDTNSSCVVASVPWPVGEPMVLIKSSWVTAGNLDMSLYWED